MDPVLRIVSGTHPVAQQLPCQIIVRAHRTLGPGGVHVGVASKMGPNAWCLAGFAERDAGPTVGVTVSAIAGLAQMRHSG
jgi:uncharacterized protein YaaW (UPF0174 family)